MRSRVVRRPLVWAALAFAAGIVLARYAGRDVVYLVFFLAVTGLWLNFWPRPRRASVVAVLTCFMAAGAFFWFWRGPETTGDPLSRHVYHDPGQYLTLEGVVHSADLILPQTGYAVFILDVEDVWRGEERLPVAGRTHVRWSNPHRAVFPGQRVRVTGPVEYALSRVNHGVRSYEGMLRRQGVHTAVQVRGSGGYVQRLEVVAEPERRGLRYWAAKARRAQAETLASVAPEAALPFIQTVWLGHRGDLGGETYDVFLRSGTAHILAVSGIHMGIVFLSVSFVLGLILPRSRLRAILIIAAVVGFAFMAGARVSALRAALMVSVYMLADCFGRERDTPTALGLAGLILLVAAPQSLFETGFQLSFMSVASILLFHEHIRDWLGQWPALPAWLRGMLGVTLGVQVLPLPFTIHLFHVAPFLGPLANLAVVPLLTAVLWCCFFASLAAPFSMGIASVLGHAAGAAAAAISAVSRFAADVPLSHMDAVSPTALAMASYWLGAALLLGAMKRRKGGRNWFLAAMVCFTAAFLTWTPWRSAPEVVFLDVGHGDSVFIRAPNGATLLYDAGDRTPYTDHGEREAAPFLRSRHVNRLDYVAVSHAHSDHMGGMIHIIETFEVGEAWLPAVHSHTALEHEFLAACRRREVPVRRLAAGARMAVGDMSVEVLHPPEDWRFPGTMNEDSLVLRADWAGATLLLTGDSETAAEYAMIQGEPPEADVMQVPHHGSSTSSAEVFIDWAAPRFAIASTGGPPVFSREVERRYLDRGIPFWRTDQAGGVRITTRRGRLRVEGARERAGFLEPVAPGAYRPR